jgi:ubiquinone/menaquinone biosynthesis C-methylase UbiE
VKPSVKILDVGVGTGIYFKDSRCIELIRSKNIKIVGIDINESDIKLASKRIVSSHVCDRVEAKFVDLFQYDVDLNEFDVILFSESFPVIPEDLMMKMLNHILHIKGFKGSLFFINNIEDNPKLLQRVKPFLKYFMFGVEFGRIVSKDDMQRVFKQAGLKEKNVSYELLANSTISYTAFRDKIKIPFWNFTMKHHLISAKS